MLVRPSEVAGKYKFASIPATKLTADAKPGTEAVTANRNAWEKLCEDDPDMFHVAKYPVQVEVGGSKEDRVINAVVSPLSAARLLLASFSRSPNMDSFCSSSDAIYKITYLIAVVLQVMIIERTEGSEGLKFLEEADISRVRDMQKLLSYESDVDIERVLKEKTVMKENVFNKLHTPVGEGEEDAENGVDTGGETEEEEDEEFVNMDGMM